MKNNNERNETAGYCLTVRRFLEGLMDECEERSFGEQLKADNQLREYAMSEALLWKTYSMEQERNKDIAKELKKMAVECLPFSHERDCSAETDHN